MVLPETAWSQDMLLSCLAEVASNPHPAADAPPPLGADTALLTEMAAPMDAETLRAHLEELHSYRDSNLQVASVVRMLVQLAQLDGPLRIHGGPLWQFRTSEGALDVEESLWVDGEGRPHPIEQLVVTGTAPAGGASIGWIFKHIG